MTKSQVWEIFAVSVSPESVSFMQVFHFDFLVANAMLLCNHFIVLTKPNIPKTLIPNAHALADFCRATKNRHLSASVRLIQTSLRQYRGLSGDI